ncbi:MAG: hypothetical protein ACT4R6_07420 [Gemmatimonadaceae bacterium]
MKPRSRRRRIGLAILLLLILPVAAFVLLEGGSSMLLFGRDLLGVRQTAQTEQVNTEYDGDIGWVAKKSFAAPNMYGPEIGLQTNSRGFRGAAAVADSLPAAAQRLVCSGDSFTLGFGVADAETWCAQLSSTNLETVNMGQVGYGLDQAYLWYRRDARNLAHTAQVFAFVTDDFRRMALDRFLGYNKPVLALQGDSLAVLGAPVARRTGRTAVRVRRVAQSLRFSQLVARLTGNDASGDTRVPRQSAGQTRSVTAWLVADLARINSHKGSRLVLVYLPIERDFVNDGARAWRHEMRVVADSLGVPLIDLIPELRTLSAEQVRSLYFQESNGVPTDGMGHFTAEGNRWAAARIREHLVRLEVLRAARDTVGR